MVCKPAKSSLTQSTCKNYTAPSGTKTWKNSGIYKDTLENASLNGCDSVITINLTINNIDSTINKYEDSLQANSSGATYQWLDCNNNFKAISGETDQSFTPQESGDYAVKITKNGCTDTSQCYSIQNVGGVLQNDFGSSLKYYPNPTNGRVKIKLNKRYEAITATVSDLSGKTINKKTFKNIKRFPVSLEGAKGYYLITIESNIGEKARIKILKK